MGVLQSRKCLEKWKNPTWCSLLGAVPEVKHAHSSMQVHLRGNWLIDSKSKAMIKTLFAQLETSRWGKENQLTNTYALFMDTVLLGQVSWHDHHPAFFFPH